jgi:hypothetical protein
MIRIKNLFFLLFSLTILSLVFKSFENKNLNGELNFNDSDISSTSSDIISNYHYWNDSFKTNYSGNFRVKIRDYQSSKSYRDNIYAESWRDLYGKISKNDFYKLEMVYSTLNDINIDQTYYKYMLANLIVSFVQSIPYSLVSQSTCSKLYLSDNSFREMIDNGTECDGDVFAGIYTPTEFIGKFKGDCDTRTLFLYTIFKKFGYDVIILNSDVYGHSILGLNILSTGRYKSYLGKRYYTWETTSEGWMLGDLPPDVSNMSNWYVALPN